jgi:hypothetical protein
MPACTLGQVCDPATSVCICPPYNPDHCPVAGVCTDFTEDPDHCGNCDTACAATSACGATGCTPEPTEVYTTGTTDCGSLYLQLDGANLYVLNAGAGTLSSVPAAGGTATDLVTGLTGASAFTFDVNNFYIAAGMSVLRAPIGGGATETVVTEASAIFDVAVAADTVYYASGTAVKSVASDATAGTGTDEGMPESGGEPQSVAVDGDYVLWGAAVAFNVESYAMTGMVVTKLGASQGDLIFGHRTLQTDGTSVFWANGSSVSYRIYEGGADAQSNAGSSIESEKITAFAINATTVYLGAGANIEKATFGEDAIRLARGQGAVHSMVLDATSVYWSTDACAINKTAL